MKEVPKHFCIYPWVHAQFDMDGSVVTCCEVSLSDRLDSVDGKELSEIWNSEGYKNIRKDLLAGKLPEQCRSCFVKEQAGYESDRIKANKWFKDQFHHIDKMDNEGALPLDTFISADIRVSNICNYRCRTCTPSASSAWAKDWIFVTGKPLPDIVKRAFSSKENFLGFFEPVLGQLQRVYFAGGEPLLMEEHYCLLEALVESGRASEVELFYNTNLSLTGFAGKDLSKLLSNFRQVSLNLSIDGTHEKGQYIRDGLNWSEFKKNRDYFKDRLKNVRFYYNLTVSNLNAFYLPEIIPSLIQELGVREEDITLNPVDTPAYYGLFNFPKELKKSVIESLESYSSTFKTDLLKEQMKAIILLIKKETTDQNLKAFRQVTKRVDQIRGQDFGSLFPEMKDLLEGKN